MVFLADEDDQSIKYSKARKHYLLVLRHGTNTRLGIHFFAR
jgi:hypothetical protein